MFFVKLEDDVRAIERAKERDLQMPLVLVRGKVGSAFSLLPLVLRLSVTTIDDIKATIVSPGIFCRYPGKAALKGMIKPCNLVPLAQIPVGIEFINPCV